MSVQIACPDPTHWRALLEGALSSEEQADLSLHLDQCDSCRQQLETLSGGDEPFTELTRRLCQPRPAVEQGLQQALAELKEHGSQVDSEPALEEDQQIPLDFLSPSENPGHLGRLSHYDVLEVIG